MPKKTKLNATEKMVSNFISSFSIGDQAKTTSFLDENVISYITNSDRMAKKLQSRSEFMTSIPNDLSTIKPTVTITQTLSVKRNLVLTMTEVKAERKGKKLHNHAAYLMKVRNKKITHIWMVDALPAYSDQFWKS